MLEKSGIPQRKPLYCRAYTLDDKVIGIIVDWRGDVPVIVSEDEFTGHAHLFPAINDDEHCVFPMEVFNGQDNN